MAITVANVITRALTKIGYASGAGANTYAEPKLLEGVQQAFDDLFLERWWPGYRAEAQYTLDGTTGHVTSSTIDDTFKTFEDVRYIYYSSDEVPLPAMPQRMNPNSINIRCYGPASTADKIVKIWPITTTGTIYVVGRTRPAVFTDADTIQLDDQLMVLAAALAMLATVGTNPSHEDLLMAQFERRKRLVYKNIDPKEIYTGSYADHITDEWTTL